MKAIDKVARDLEIDDGQVTLHGKWKAKISLQAIRAGNARRRGKLILVTGMTPTPYGEGKTVTSIGLGMGLNKLGRRAVTLVRQPSLGPVFGIKGGGGVAERQPWSQCKRLTCDSRAT